MALIKKNTLSWFDYFLIIGVVVSTLIYSYLTKEFDPIGFIAGFAQIVCVVLVAKGNILNYAFGLVSVSLYAYIAYKSSLWGNAALNALYYLPMQFIGYFSWKNHKQEGDSTKVQARRMNAKQLVVLAVVSIVATVVCSYILKRFNGNNPFVDAASIVFSIIAQLLMVKAFTEQWYLWIITNVINVTLWVMCVVEGEPHAFMMVIMWSFCLANSINGVIQWRRLSETENIRKQSHQS